jgi:hypothetical protein
MQSATPDRDVAASAKIEYHSQSTPREVSDEQARRAREAQARLQAELDLDLSIGPPGSAIAARWRYLRLAFAHIRERALSTRVAA